MNKMDLHNEQTTGTAQRLHKLYAHLVEALEAAEDKLLHCNSGATDRVCLTIIEEDLTTLVEECENYLIGGFWPKKEDLQSLESRAFCVLEEFCDANVVPPLVARSKNSQARLSP